MKKRFLSLLLALALALSLATAAFAGAETAQLSSQKLRFNGADRSDVEKYNIDGSNFFKLRDLAALLDGTAAQFDVRLRQRKPDRQHHDRRGLHLRRR